MTEPMAADDVCEHHYDTRILGGHPIAVRACTLCRTPDWNDLDEQAIELYWWGWQEGRTGKPARAVLSAYDRPSRAHSNSAASSDTADNSALREAIAAVLKGATLVSFVADDGHRAMREATGEELADAVLAVQDRELEQLREMYQQQSAANASYRLQIDELIRRNGEYANRAISNGQRADRLAATLREVLAAVFRRGGVPPTEAEHDRWRAALDGQEPR